MTASPACGRGAAAEAPALVVGPLSTATAAASPPALLPGHSPCCLRTQQRPLIPQLGHRTAREEELQNALLARARAL